MSVIAAFASFQFSGIFVAQAVGNGVITVMINSPWQALDDDADNWYWDNRGDSAPLSISLCSAASLNFAQSAVSLMLELTITSADGKARYCCNGRLPDGYHHDQSWVKRRQPICCNATASWLFGRKSFRPNCLRWLHNGKEAGSVRRLLIWVLGLAWQVCEGDQIISK